MYFQMTLTKRQMVKQAIHKITPSSLELNNCKLEYSSADNALSFKGLIKPTELNEETETRYGYCNLKSKIIQFGRFPRIFPIFNLDIFGNFEIVYRGGEENEISTCLLNIFTKPSIISLPALYQVPFEVKAGWNRLIVPFSGINYLSEDWHDMEKIFDPARVCMFGFNFVAKEQELKFDFKLHSIVTSPLLDQFGRCDVREVWECEAKEPFQIRLSSPNEQPEEQDQVQPQKKRAFSNELR
jgi:hypothetical protein